MIETKSVVCSDLYAQEMAGMGVSNQTYTIKGKFITSLKQRKPHVFTRNPQSIHIGIDPHGGGKTSDTAIVAMCQDQGRKVVCLYALLYHAHMLITKSVVRLNSLSCGVCARTPPGAHPRANASNDFMRCAMKF